MCIRDRYESGKEIEYTIKELDTISGYESKIESDKDGNFILTNTHAVELINKTVAKIWNDSNNQDGIRPNEVKVQLLANGKAFGEVLTMNEMCIRDRSMRLHLFFLCLVLETSTKETKR